MTFADLATAWAALDDTVISVLGPGAVSGTDPISIVLHVDATFASAYRSFTADFALFAVPEPDGFALAATALLFFLALHLSLRRQLATGTAPFAGTSAARSSR